APLPPRHGATRDDRDRPPDRSPPPAHDGYSAALGARRTDTRPNAQVDDGTGHEPRTPPDPSRRQVPPRRMRSPGTRLPPTPRPGRGGGRRPQAGSGAGYRLGAWRPVARSSPRWRW